MFTERTSVGLDVHARSVVAAAIDGVTGELVTARMSPAGDEVVGWVQALPGPVAVTYEAGPTGFGLARRFSAVGVRCEVAAPSKVQRPAGERVKTDLKDAVLLARLLRMDEITAVAVPGVDQEAARDLVRAREDARGDLMRARHRLSKLLLRYAIVYCGGKAWTGKHDRWLSRDARTALAAVGGRGIEAVFDNDYDQVLAVLARRERLDEQIAVLAADSEFTPLVRRLCCLRGVATLTGFALAVEIGEWDRFTGASIGSFVGLTPTESSSGQTRSLGPITRAGNTHVRRLLIEAAWHHRKPYRLTQTLQARHDLAPPAARARADKANRRLHQRWVRFDARAKKPVIANTAIARELAGWCWSLAVMD